MDTQNLKAFIAVARQSSFSLAAEQLSLTQPAVSKRISLLEADLDVPLFDRIGRTVSLTEHGKKLLPQARDIMQRLDDARLSLQGSSGSVTGSLSLSISHHIGLHRLPPVLKTFARRHPDVQLDVTFTDSELAYGSVARGEIELAVITLAPEADPQIETRLIWPDNLRFAVSPEHELATSDKLTLSELSKHAAILPNRSTYTGTLIADLFQSRKLKLKMNMATNYMETIKSMASTGLGWTVIPESMLDDTLVPLEVSDAQLVRELGVINHRNRHLSNAARAFIIAVEEFSSVVKD